MKMQRQYPHGERGDPGTRDEAHASDGRHPALRVVRDRARDDRIDTLAANDAHLQRAGLRRRHADAEPAAAFVVVEMAVLVVVAALAMASIIVTSGCAGIEASSGGGHVAHTASFATPTRA